MLGRGITLREYIAQLQELERKHGPNVQCWDNGGGDYPEGAAGPVYIANNTERRDPYYPAGVVVLR